MKGKAHKRGRWLLLPAFAVLVLLVPVQRSIVSDPGYRKEYVNPAVNLGSVREGGTVALMAMLGGFRPLVSNLLWLKVDEFWHRGGSGYWRMVGVLQAICEMDPHFIDAWSTFGWHCAWNIYVDAPVKDRPKWVQTGIEIYQRGIKFNPDRYDLYKDLAWLYHDKLRDYERAIPAWQETLKHPDAPIYVRHMIAHCYENTWQVDKAIATWKECLKEDPTDVVAKAALDWWRQQTADPEKLKAEKLRILVRENGVRRSRQLPMMEEPHSIR
ncbi:MAG TPA: tetratricopeptide repeat protein [Armatimonadota bacterium]|nr:tetratricopeptide repeat protein [Armatimonadota bacterium]